MYTNKGNKKKGKRAAKQQQERDRQAQAQQAKKADSAGKPGEEPQPDDVAVEDTIEEKEDHGHAEFVYKNIFYEWFYRVSPAHPQRQLKSHIGEAAGFQKFMDCIRTKLPVAFRLNKSYMNFDVIRQKFNDEEFFRRNFFSFDGSSL